MKFKLNFDVLEGILNLSHKDSAILIGSCFSDEMNAHYSFSGYHVLSNPFGTIFHPTAIYNVINSSLIDNEHVDTLEADGLHYSWDSAHKVYGGTSEDLNETILSLRKKIKTELLNAGLLIVTFGTAWGYRLKESGLLVGNCHKAPANSFIKELSSVDEMKQKWDNLIPLLKTQNPNLKIVFTVSPVRHKKDGLSENNRSKARLIELAHYLVEKYDKTFYFPSYEILIDELRDYRFYAEDLVHPSSQAIEYIWEKFERFAFTLDTIALNDRVRSLNRALRHKSNNQDSRAEADRVAKLEADKDALLRAYPEIIIE